MARTRAQTAADKERTASTQQTQDKKPQGASTCRGDHSHPKPSPPQHRGHGQPSPSVIQQPLSEQVHKVLDEHGTKRLVDAPDLDIKAAQERPELSSTNPLARKHSGKLGSIEFWAKEWHWPEEYFEPITMEPRLLAQRPSLFPLDHKGSLASDAHVTSIGLSTAYYDWGYEKALRSVGVHLEGSCQGITDTSKALLQSLLTSEQPVPSGTIFDDAEFVGTCRDMRGMNEAEITRNVCYLLVPSVKTRRSHGRHIIPLHERANASWKSSIPLTRTPPQPDLSVGFAREAFTEDQLSWLSPCIGNHLLGEQSFFMATPHIYFPFFTCEVKGICGSLDVADRQNAHSMAVAMKGVYELFRAVHREAEINRQILGFSISHNHRDIRIYGHYPVINGEDVQCYRHLLCEFNFANPDGGNKWVAYRFTKNMATNPFQPPKSTEPQEESRQHTEEHEEHEEEEGSAESSQERSEWVSEVGSEDHDEEVSGEGSEDHGEEHSEDGAECIKDSTKLAEETEKFPSFPSY